MKRLTFEKICRESKLRPVLRETIANHVVLIADGWFSDHPENRGPHYKTLWAVARDDDRLKVARPLYFNGGIGSTTLQERIAAALADAQEMAEGLNGRGL